MAPAATNGHSNGISTSSANARTLVPGVYVPTVVFFDSDGETVDIGTVEKHATYLASAGVAGLVTHGSNGEAVHLDHGERAAVNAATRKALDAAGYSSIPVIVGCGAASTRETIQLCKEASESGGSFALVLPPSYYKSLINTKQLLQHFVAVADASPVPIIIYNFPGAASGLDMDSDQILELAGHPNIIGCKLTCGNTGKLARVAAGAKAEFLTMGGSADFILPTLVVNGQGTIAGLANLAPRACIKVMELYKQGKLAEAQKLQAIVARGDWVAIKGGFIAVKAGLEAYRGYGGPPRLPCVGPDQAALKTLSQDFAELMELEHSLEKVVS